MPFSTGATWPALANRTASAADVNNKFEWVEGHRYPHNSGALTTGAYDIGSSAYQWNKAYFSDNLILENTSTITSLFFGGRVASWGMLTYSGGTATANGSFNISSIVTEANSFIITMVNPMENSEVCGIATVRGSTNYTGKLNRWGAQNKFYVHARDTPGNIVATNINFVLLAKLLVPGDAGYVEI